MARERGKKYVEAAKQVEPGRLYSPAEAVALVKQVSYASFDATVEVHVRLGLDVRHADQQVRSVAVLPHGLGRTMRVLVFTQGEGIRLAEDAGADYVGADDLIKRIEGGWLEFDVAVATPDMMGKVGRLGRILGRRGLMPNPKSGTIAPAEQLPRLIREVRGGRLEFRTEKVALVHAPVGKVSFSAEQLLENFGAFVDAVLRARPSGAKGQYLRGLTIAPTMGPGVEVDVAQAMALAQQAAA